MKFPAQPFYLFGMGPRPKLLYRDGRLVDPRDGSVRWSWDVASERIEPSEYRVTLETRRGEPVVIHEDEAGVWLLEGAGRLTALAQAPVKLPRFEGHPYAAHLRILHQEILVNLTPAGPLPNLFVYAKPWFRDAAMMAMVLERTGNTMLLEAWVDGLREPFDRNNAGHREPDNLGQVLYLTSLFEDKRHPLIESALKAASEFRKDGHLVGLTDGAEHPVYQTKWMKFGLTRLGLDDPYKIPAVPDSYSALFWWDWRTAHIPVPRFGERDAECYPYLVWAHAHFFGERPPLPRGPENYPLSWEAHASEADYKAMNLVHPGYAAMRLSAPHTWHAAEMFLWLREWH